MSRMAAKPGVQPRLVYIINGVANVAAKMSEPSEVVITSCMDSTHGEDSLHYALRAADVRTKNFPSVESKEAFVRALQRELGPQFDVILEQLGRPNEHVHVEFDPK